MSKSRTDYTYVAARLASHVIEPYGEQNLGDFSIYRKAGPKPPSEVGYRPPQHYHYNSHTGVLTNRGTLLRISKGSRTHQECLAALARLFADDVESWIFAENLKRMTDN